MILLMVIKILFLGGRCAQGIEDITRNINKPKMTLKTFYVSLLFEPIECIECMDTIRVVYFLYYEPMMWVLCLKPSFFVVINHRCILTM